MKPDIRPVAFKSTTASENLMLGGAMEFGKLNPAIYCAPIVTDMAVFAKCKPVSGNSSIHVNF